MNEWKETEISLIPKEWKEYKISDLINTVIDNRGKTPPLAISGYKLIETYQISKNNLFPIYDNSKQKYVAKNIYNNWFRSGHPEKDDILFTTVGENVPQFCLVDEEKICVAQNLIALRVNKNIVDSFYLFNYFRQPKFIKQVKNILLTTAQPSVKVPHLLNLLVYIPDIQNQIKISNLLKSLDEKIENLRKQNETLESIAQTLFKHWFIDFEFPNEDGKPYKSSGGEMRSTELGEIPKDWQVGKIGKEVETIGGGTPSTKEPTYWENGNIPWYSPTDLTKSGSLFSLDSEKKITKLGLEKSSAKLFPAYSLLLTSRATVGVVSINTKASCTNQGFITIIPNKKFSVYFLYGWLLTKIELIKLLASGSTFPEISKSNFRDLDFIIPTEKILNKHSQLINPIFHKIELNTKQIQTLTKTRDELLPKLMSGQIRVKDEITK